MPFRGCSVLNALNLEKGGVQVHNCALLLDLPALFGYIARMPLIFRISPETCLKLPTKTSKLYPLLLTLNMPLFVRCFNRIQPSVGFHMETSHLIFTANQITGFHMECNTGLKWVKVCIWQFQTILFRRSVEFHHYYLRSEVYLPFFILSFT